MKQLNITSNRKHGTKCLSLLAAVAVFSGYLNAAWDVKNPPGAAVVDFDVSISNSSTLFATAVVVNEGIWKSIDSGDNWALSLGGTDYDGVAIKPDNDQIALAGVSGGVIDRTVNGGTSWSSTASASEGRWYLAFSSDSPAIVYAGGFTDAVLDTGKIQRSTDAGATWTSLSIDGDANPPILSLAVDPNDANTVYVGAKPSTPGLNDGLYKSTDGGTTWQLLYPALDVTAVDAVAVDANDSRRVYAGSRNGFIYRSLDSGATWSPIHDPGNDVGGFNNLVNGIAINPADSRVIYAVGGNGGATKVIVSTDCGVTWSNVDSTGITAGQPDKVIIDDALDFVFLVERTFSTQIYRNSVAAGTGAACPSGNSGGGSSSSSSSGGGGGGSVGFLFLLFGNFVIGVKILRLRKTR